MIPVVDFVNCGISYTDDQLKLKDKLTTGREICQAFKTSGFLYLINHGIPEEKVVKANGVAREFFTLHPDVKKRCARTSHDDNFGYVGMEVEQLSAERPGDLKEAFNVTPKQANDSAKWPREELPDFEPLMWDLYNDCSQLSLRILHLIGLGLDLKDPDFFVKAHGQLHGASGTALRALYYPPLPLDFEIKKNQIRCGEHTDYGSITLLFQDQVGGLQVMNREKDEFVSATPIPGAVIVNIGGLMQRWTSDVLVAMKHRVIIPEGEIKRREVRQSLGFFAHPDDAKVIECIDGSNKYEPITALDYLNMRLDATY